MASAPIHATQLYSIAGNVVIGVLLLRLFWVAAAAAVMGLVHWFAMGVDFPESNRRFARLSG